MCVPVGHCTSSQTLILLPASFPVFLVFIFSCYFILATAEKPALPKQAFMERNVM